MSLKLLPRKFLLKTSETDHADWTYRFPIGFVRRRRFRLCLKLLGNKPYQNLLVIGYGSGVFLPELRRRTARLYGIDVHQRPEDVAAILESVGVSAELTSGSPEQLPYPSASFDAIVAVSALEFVEDIESAAASIARVLTSRGTLVVVTPASSCFVDFLLWLFTGVHAELDFQDRRENVLPALTQHFRVDGRRVFPNWLRWLLPVYYGYAFHKKSS